MVKAVIMAGGKGSRLRPLTSQLPKPMVPLLDRPCMEYIIRLLKRHGIADIAVTVQYLGSVIKHYFGDGRELGVNLHYFDEIEPLGTAGGVKNVESFLDDTFLVISGDALTDFDLGEAVRFHRAKRAVATLILTQVEVPLEFGVVMTDNGGKITRFLEKPSWGEVFSDKVNTGIYVLEPEIFDMILTDAVVDFSKDVFPKLVQDDRPLYGYEATGYWSDIGNLSQYRQAQFDMLDGRLDVQIKAQEIRPGIWCGEKLELGKNVSIEAPSYIGSGTSIGDNSVIGPYSILGKYSHVGRKAVIDRSVLWRRDYVGPSVSVQGATICNDVTIGAGTEVGEDSVIGDKTKIGKRVVIRPGIKVWPEKQIADETTQQSSLIWGNSMFASLFGEDGISGVANLEIIPEMISRVSAAYGSCLVSGASVLVSSDQHPFSGILRFAAISSLMAIGIQVRDAGVVPVPVVRYDVRRSNCQGGLHIRSVDTGEDNQMVIQFFDKFGLPIDKGTERKVESAFFQEDFSRPSLQGLGALEQSGQIVRFYMEEVLGRVNESMIQTENFKIIFESASAQEASVMIPIFERLNCQVMSIMRSKNDMGALVRSNHADLGVRLSKGGQAFTLYAEDGTELSDEQALILQMLMAIKEGAPVGVPVTAPSVIEEMSEFVGIPLVRTKTVWRSLLEVGSTRLIQVHFDGFYSVVAVLQFLCEEGLTLGEVIRQFPLFHMYTQVVGCPIEAKGRVMRKLLEDVSGERLQLIDGIKVLTDDGWALILPDSDLGRFKIVTQGVTLDVAQSLADRYKSKIEQFQESEVS